MPGFRSHAGRPGGTPAEGAILYIGCGGSAVRIGKVESYRSRYNPAMRGLAVVVHDRGRTRVLVARQEA